MIEMVEKVPDRGSHCGYARRMNTVKQFLESGFRCAEVTQEEGENPRRIYNGILMAARRLNAKNVRILWRNSRVFLERTEEQEEE